MKRIAFLMSDTGGGHRAAGRALEYALNTRYPGQFETVYVDVFREYAPFPWSRSPEIYPWWIQHHLPSHSLYYLAFDYLMQLPLPDRLTMGAVGAKGLRQLIDTYQPDLAVVLHGAFTRFAVGARKLLKVDLPVLTVITDMAKPHFAWYHPDVDRLIVPCAGAYQRALSAGVRPEKIFLLGHPAHPKFTEYNLPRPAARQELGWLPDKPAIMLIGGGDGMGRLDAISAAINQRRLDAQLHIICGRNDALKAQLEAVRWHQPTRIYGFVDNIEKMMQAADVLITKAGPGTIAEAAISGLPMILSGAIPHQETPNVDYVVEAGAGLYAHEPQKIAYLLQDLLRPGSDHLARMAAATARIAFPEAAWDTAGHIAELSGAAAAAPA